MTATSRAPTALSTVCWSLAVVPGSKPTRTRSGAEGAVGESRARGAGFALGATSREKARPVSVSDAHRNRGESFTRIATAFRGVASALAGHRYAPPRAALTRERLCPG